MTLAQGLVALRIYVGTASTRRFVVINFLRTDLTKRSEMSIIAVAFE